MLKFITGSKHKLQEIAAAVGEGKVEQLDIDLPELQEIDPRVVIQEKLREAMRRRPEAVPLMVEDTSLFMNCLAQADGTPGLPGPLIKWFMKTVGREGLWRLAERAGEFGAEARTTIGLAYGPDDIRFFEGRTKGKIVAPRGDSDFGWDPVFCPEGQEKTYAEMSTADKNEMSHRGKAARLLREHLES